MTRSTALLYLLAMMIILALVGSLLVFQEEDYKEMSQDLDELEDRIEELGKINEENKMLLEKVRALEAENEVLLQELNEMQDWINQWDIEMNEVTYYAPLDPTAIEGMCYQGCPNTTASGAQVEIGRTIAAGPSVPFGTLVLVEGHGIYEVQDRGGAIHDGHLDIAIWDKGKAYSAGRQQLKVAYQK